MTRISTYPTKRCFAPAVTLLFFWSSIEQIAAFQGARPFAVTQNRERQVQQRTRTNFSKLRTSGFPTEERSWLTMRNQDLRAVKISTLEDDVQRRRTGSSSSSIDRAERELQLSQAGAPTTSFLEDTLPVLSAASLVTGSTVGASMLTLPDLAAEQGLGSSSALFTAAWMVCLISGLGIADVAIHQHESSDSDVPSSFKEFAESNLDNGLLAKAVSAIPVFVNSLVLIFDVSKAGDLASSLLSGTVDPLVASFGFAAVLGTLLCSFNGSRLSAVASMCVLALFLAFGSLLLPGLTGVQDPIGTWMDSGTASDRWLDSMMSGAPIVLTALQFQNIVPSITKILKYNRQKTVTAITLGSAVPLAMYIAWCYVVLGGGVDATGVAGPLFAVFSCATIFGSSIGSSMSITEEVENYVASTDNHKKNTFSIPAVAMSLAVPMAGVAAFSNGAGDVTRALGLAGSYGSPLLYGIIPAMMALNQRRKANLNTEYAVPGGLTSMGALGIAAAFFVGQGLVHDVNDLLSVTT